jgi:hypothetical protein
MKKIVLVLILASLPASLFAQDWRGRRRSSTPRDNSFDITATLGYRYGGTIRADQTNLFNEDVDLQSSASYGVSLGIPVNPEGLKLELMINRQDTTLGTGGGLFVPAGRVGDFHITNYQAGLLIPFNQTRSITPYAIVSAGIANLDPATQGVASANRFAASGGIGVKVPFDRNLSLRLEARGYFTSLGNDNNNCNRCFNNSVGRDLYQGETSLGLVMRF